MSCWKQVAWIVVLMFSAAVAPGGTTFLDFGPEEIVRAGGQPLAVFGYSVPSFADWNNDSLQDLVVGEGGGTTSGKVRVYLNTGTATGPKFDNSFYAQSAGSDLTVTPDGCMGSFPRLLNWDGDGHKDLLVGLSDGTVRAYLNVGTDAQPVFDAGTPVKVGTLALTLDVGKRATPDLTYWNADEGLDLVIGGLDGYIHVYLNCGCDGFVPPHFNFSTPDGSYAQANGIDLLVPTTRSSPVVVDLDQDGLKDFITGNTEGQMFFYKNIGTNETPKFGSSSPILSNGVAIDLAGFARSRPSLCDWTGDGHLDLLVGAGDGKVHLYQAVPEPTTIMLLGIGALGLIRRNRRR